MQRRQSRAPPGRRRLLSSNAEIPLGASLLLFQPKLQKPANGSCQRRMVVLFSRPILDLGPVSLHAFAIGELPVAGRPRRLLGLSLIDFAISRSIGLKTTPDFLA